MKKQELLQLLADNEVTTRNLKSFCNKNKKLNINYIKTLDWLDDVEAKNRANATIAGIKREAKKFKLSIKEYKALQIKANTILESFHTGHSMGCYRKIEINRKTFCCNNTLSSYSKSCSYEPTYGNIAISLTKTQLHKIEEIHGVWTIKYPNHKCKTIEHSGHKQYYTITVKDSYIFGDSHGDTLQEAKETFRNLLLQRKRNKLKDNKFVGFDHLRKSGACDPGIKAFATKHSLDIRNGYTVEFLKELDPYNYYLNNL